MAGERPHMIGSPGYSPALKYEIQLAETLSESGRRGISSGSPSLERTRASFEILDALIPQLGVFQHVVKMIRDEMHLAVFSKELTSTQALLKDSTGPYLSHIPYFTIALKWINRRDNNVERLNSEVEALKNEQADNQLARERAEQERDHHKNLHEVQQSAFVSLQSQVESLTAESVAVKEELNQTVKKREEDKCDQDFIICQLENKLSEKNETVKKLEPFKKTHDVLQMKFAEPRSSIGQQWQGTVLVSKKLQLQQGLRSALHIQKQLQDMENSLLNDYDSLLLANKAALADPDCIDVHMLVRSKQKSFRQSIEELSNELKLLATHIEQLQIQLEAMNKLNEKEEPFLTLENPAHPNNPLHAQEQILSKYAAVMSFSLDDASTFLPLQDGQHCFNCGVQTVFCPHKSFAEGLVLPLPPSATHIRLSRPAVTLPAKDSDEANDLRLPHTTPQGIPDYTTPDFAEIRRLCNERCPLPKRPPRSLNEEVVLAVVELFYASVLRQDELIISESIERVEDLTTTDAFISFIVNRYGNIKDAACCALQDVLSSVEALHKNHKTLLLFAQQLSHFIDSTAFRYSLCLTELVFQLPWINVREFEFLCKVLYPFLEEEAVEDLVVELYSFTGSSLCPSLVLDFVLLLLLKEQEPRVSKMQTRLMTFQMRQPEFMSETEFLMAVDQLAPGTPDKLTRYLFAQSMDSSEEGEGRSKMGVVAPVAALACIVSYLSVREEMNSLLKKLEELMEAAIASGRLPPKDSWTKWEKPGCFAGMASVAAKASVLKLYGHS